MKKYFLTYGDKNFYLSKKHLINLAKRSDLFHQTIALGFNDLDKEFVNTYSSILKVSKGGGFWIWKHRIIKNLLNDIAENDIIIYCDAGASLNLNNNALKRFNEYIDILQDSEYGNFRMQSEKQFKENQYSTKEIFRYFQISPNSEIGNSTQLQAGHMIFQKNQHTKDIINEFEKVLIFDSELITDKYNDNGQIEGFVSNRHDQSIFSLLTKKYGGVIIENETEFKHRPDKQYDFPFLSVRTYGHGIKDYIDFLLLNRSRLNETIFFDE